MRVAVVSDTHFGDPLGTLVARHDGRLTVGPAYEPLKAAIGRVDYLVLLGDIVDFSVASYDEAYGEARAFFAQLQKDGLAREIIYIPGNHDYDVWHTVEHQVNVINRLQQGQLPRAFKRSMPGVIDDRRSKYKFVLPDVVPSRLVDDPDAHYGDLFFDDISRESVRGRIVGDKLTFNFAYPNLYLVTDAGESILLTHGHYFEAFWAVTSELTAALALDDLELESEGGLSLREMVGINLPLNQLACSGIGQSKPLAELARRVHADVSAGRFDDVGKYFDRLGVALRKDRSLPLASRWALSMGVRIVKRKLLGAIASIPQARYSKEFLARPRVRERFRKYYRYSLHEIERLRSQHGLDIPPPSFVVFGHTHQPISWGARELFDVVDGRTVGFCNTGGWVLKEERDDLTFEGAEVLVYESGHGVESVSIRTEQVFYSGTASSTSRSNGSRSSHGPRVSSSF